MSKIKKSGLGKGLDILFVDNNTDENRGSILLKISEIEPNKNQPRKDFEQDAIAELAQSIREHGIIQPLLVRPLTTGTYQIVAGERRWRASRMAGLTEVPVIVRELSDEQTMELALIENLQRQDLNAIEEALGYRTLIDEYKMTQEQVAIRVGKSRPVVANALRLLALPQEILTNVRKGVLTSGHARALLSIEDKQQMVQTADRIVKEGLSVREIEQLGKKIKLEKQQSQLPPQSSMQISDVNKRIWDNSETFYKEMELALAQELSRKVKINVGTTKGSIEIEFYNESELGELASRLIKRKLNYER